MLAQRARRQQKNADAGTIEEATKLVNQARAGVRGWTRITPSDMNLPWARSIVGDPAWAPLFATDAEIKRALRRRR